MFLGGNEAVNNTMHQQLPAASYAGLPHAPTIQQVNNLGPVNPEPQSPINPALMAQPNQQQMQVIAQWKIYMGQLQNKLLFFTYFFQVLCIYYQTNLWPSGLEHLASF